MPTLKEQDPSLHRDLMNRMRRIEGQVRGVQRMLDQGAECDEIVVQIAAVRAALARAGMKLVTCQLGAQMSEELRKGGTGEGATAELMDTFLRLN